MKKPKDNTGSSQKSKTLTPDDIVAFLKSRSGRASKAALAKKFGITGDDRNALKHLVKEMLVRGTLHHGTFRSYVLPDAVQEPQQKAPDLPPEPLPKRAVRQDSGIRRHDVGGRNPHVFIGLFQPQADGGGMINPVSRQDKHPVIIEYGRTNGARRGDLVQATQGPRGWAIDEVIGEQDDAGLVSLMAIKTLDIPHVFPPEVLDATHGMTVPELGDRTDLRKLKLVTIDGEDARDFDDAVHAVSDKKGGWKITVAIADVSHYVPPGSPLDIEAYKRGNSVYFPDRVVPMLPEPLSNDLCSLRPKEDRACMAALMHIDSDGQLQNVQIVRGLMKSVARLTYNEVQEAFDGQPNDKTKPLLKTVLEPLYGAYQTLQKARLARGTVELDLPERKVQLVSGQIQDIVSRARYDSHKLIEELMILANVAVAKALENKRQDALYRVHPRPDASRWSNTREFLQEMGFKTRPGVYPKSEDLQNLLDQAKGRDEAPLVNDMVLRSMSQASYSPSNVGHFGLALEHYAHFTSPIRRYADLIVHRALIRTFNLGTDGLTNDEMQHLDKIGTHISERERVAQSAERETIDRYIALYMEDKVGATFAARISGVTHFGLFVNVAPMGADGMIPVRSLPDDFYIHDEKRHALVGRRRGLTFRLAMPLTVRLLEVEAATGRLLMEMVVPDGGIPEPDRRQSVRRPERSSGNGWRERGTGRGTGRQNSDGTPRKRR